MRRCASIHTGMPSVPTLVPSMSASTTSPPSVSSIPLPFWCTCAEASVGEEAQMCEHGLVPKIVDHEARRAEIALAVRRLVAREGLAGATVRAVAEESGWSMGAVRYYFASQDQLLVFAVESMMEQVTERVLRIRERMPAGPDRAAALIEQLLPQDRERRAEGTVWLAALARARHASAMDELR